MAETFPDAPIYTSLYEPSTTFPEFADRDVRVPAVNRLTALRADHRRALPILPFVFDRMRVDADVAICSSSGWAHGAQITGRKIVYCYTPARWLYQTDAYLGGARRAPRVVIEALRPWLTRWDRRAAASADRYLAISTVVQERVQERYRREADILPAPHSVDPAAARQPLPGVDAGYFLVISRLLPYKNVDVVVRAFEALPDERLVVVGAGPERSRLGQLAGSNVHLTGSVSDAELRWLYANCEAVVSASYEDFGLTPLEGAAFGKPAVVLRWGGFVDTTVEGRTGVFFHAPSPQAVAAAVRAARGRQWDPAELRDHAARFSVDAFGARLRDLVAELRNAP